MKQNYLIIFDIMVRKKKRTTKNLSYDELFNELKNMKQTYLFEKNKKEMFTNKFIETTDTNIANIIHNNMHLIQDNKKEMLTLLEKVYNEKYLIRELLEYELINYEPTEKIENVDQLIDKTKEILKRYQWKVGGTKIEDDNWIVLDDTSKQFVIENEKILMNTISPDDAIENDFLIFINRILILINKYTTKIEVTLKLKECYDLCWILIIFPLEDNI